jgi:hypothetical protein
MIGKALIRVIFLRERVSVWCGGWSTGNGLKGTTGREEDTINPPRS